MTAITDGAQTPAPPLPAAADAERGGGVGLGVVLVIWTLAPIYNMVMVSLSPQ